MKQCVIVVDDKHPQTPEGYNVSILLECLKTLARQQGKDIVFAFVFAEDGFTEPITVYLVALHALAAQRAGYSVGGLASDCWKQGSDQYGEGEEGGLLLLKAIEGILDFPVNPEHFAAAQAKVAEEWATLGVSVDISDINADSLQDVVTDNLDGKPVAFYTATFVDVKKLERKYKRKIVWIQSLQPMDRAVEMFKELGL